MGISIIFFFLEGGREKLESRSWKDVLTGMFEVCVIQHFILDNVWAF